MLRVVIDTSSLVSYVLTQGELLSRVILHWRAGDIIVLSSPATRTELEDVLARPEIRRLADAPLDTLPQGLERFSEHVAGELKVEGVCRDPKDDKFLACAVEGNAHYIVSSDNDLLELRYFQDVAIVNPGQFLLAFELHSMDAAEIAARFDADVLEDIRRSVPLEPSTAANVAEALTRVDG